MLLLFSIDKYFSRIYKKVLHQIKSLARPLPLMQLNYTVETWAGMG